MPDNGSYRSYADVGRPYVVWNVVAAPEFSVDPKEWCYPIVGCVAYRGYFVERRARAFGDALRSEGFDVSVGGVAAYSTLGSLRRSHSQYHDRLERRRAGGDHFPRAHASDDLYARTMPISTRRSRRRSRRKACAAGSRRWAASGDLARYELEQKRSLEVVALLESHARRAAHALWLRDRPRAHARAQGRRIRGAARVICAARPGLGRRIRPFESWFEGDINNAQLASIATYYDCVPGFRRELAAVGGDLDAFYRRVRELAKLDQEQRDALVCGAR